MSKESLGDFSRLPFRKRIKLTKESIQKDLEASDYLFPKNVIINTKYIIEIIEQAERVQELEDKLARIRFVNNDYDKQNRRYREALQQILEPLNQTPYEKEHTYRQIARQALEGDLE